MENESINVSLRTNEIVLKWGDLVLLRIENEGTPEKPSSEFGLLSVYSGDPSHSDILYLSNCYRLNGPSRFGGDSMPIIVELGGPMIYRDSKIYHSGWVGKDLITRALRDWDGYDVHADLVSKLSEPHMNTLRDWDWKGNLP